MKRFLGVLVLGFSLGCGGSDATVGGGGAGSGEGGAGQGGGHPTSSTTHSSGTHATSSTTHSSGTHTSTTSGGGDATSGTGGHGGEAGSTGGGSVGGSGQGGATTTTTTTTTTTGPTTTTSTASGAGGGNCDGLGVCGGATSGCTQCALDGPCDADAMACQASTDCLHYRLCVAMCTTMSQMCIDACRAAASSQGLALSDALTSCVYCQECPHSCPNQATCP